MAKAKVTKSAEITESAGITSKAEIDKPYIVGIGKKDLKLYYKVAGKAMKNENRVLLAAKGQSSYVKAIFLTQSLQHEWQIQPFVWVDRIPVPGQDGGTFIVTVYYAYFDATLSKKMIQKLYEKVSEVA